MFFIPDGSFKSFENYTVKLLVKETKWTSFGVRTHPTFLETLISKYDIRPVKLPGLSRNGPQDSTTSQALKLTMLHSKDQSSLNFQGVASLIRACRVMIHVQLLDMYFDLVLE